MPTEELVQMPNNKTAYNTGWEHYFNWLSRFEMDKYVSRCNICKKNFQISNSGLGQIKQHSEFAKHKSFLETISGQKNSQLTFVSNKDGVQLSSVVNK